VKADNLNVREGPGTSYRVIASVPKGEIVLPLAGANNCAWLRIRTPKGAEGWVLNQSDLLGFTGSCSSLAVAGTPTITPSPTRRVTPQTPVPVPTSQGCILILNELGVTLTATFTSEARDWHQTFRVPIDVQYPFCLEAGKYTYIVDAPGAWGDVEGEVTIHAGDRYRWPIRPSQ
jgi:hypothetical protein